ncbi:ABC transporter substrate-binding protein [Novosphingobium mangrovi (ex Huang et al. 2023)]|uniref:Helical backbone metal receptor n=1 Tax=Novosphingobium mangrovi (ex Huang et al. 2023) TaxID=2976432 RepID=A0ABT2I4X3_9SPHN|nr:helical backbone metal receptor [Novosphingobium mangrovi (ex Huang et al. 2023)]MCT2399857.1 helical backbone metal receptor [Novosphingobium mangrovi (ex Huang et al. 2023)]
MLLCTLLAGCTIGDTASMREADYPTIVSLNPCSDAVLAEVTAPGQLLAVSHYSHDPASSSMDVDRARRFPATSGSVEEVAALAPDVVVAGAFLAPATRQALHDLGIRVVTMTMPADIAASEAQVRDLAQLAGYPEAGRALVERIEEAMAKAAPPAGRPPVSALVWESGGIVAGDGTLIADLLKHAGFVNGAAARGLSQADYLPLERVLADPPEVIFAVGNPQSQEDRLLRHPALKALKGTARASLDSSLLWCGGPTIPKALERLSAVRRASTGSARADRGERHLGGSAPRTTNAPLTLSLSKGARAPGGAR